MPRKALTPEEARELLAKHEAKCKSFAGHVVAQVSGGLGSAEALRRCVEWYGPERVSALFANTGSEDVATYRFVVALENYVGVEIRTLKPFPGDIFDCFDREGVMRIKGACKASLELKQKPLDAASGFNWVAIGFGCEELERVRDCKLPAIFPLLVRPRLGAGELIEQWQDRLPLPPAYSLDGIPHNNCLGTGGCILGGIKYWSLRWKQAPEAFAYAERRERAFFERTGFSILRDQSGKKVRAMPLYELRRKLESGEVKVPEFAESTCGCMNT